MIPSLCFAETGSEGLNDESSPFPCPCGDLGWDGAGRCPQPWGPCVSSQVIGALPWVVNSASVAAPAPAPSLQVQAVTPQLLLNAQGQVIATLASSTLPPPVAVRKPSTPESPAKSEVPGLGWGPGGRQAVWHGWPPSILWAGQRYLLKPREKVGGHPRVEGPRESTQSPPGGTAPAP